MDLFPTNASKDSPTLERRGGNENTVRERVRATAPAVAPGSFHAAPRMDADMSFPKTSRPRSLLVDFLE